MSSQQTAEERRQESKYLLHENAYRQVVSLLNREMTRDPNQGVDNTISTLYFDTPRLDLWNALDRSQVPRYKLRIRSYGSPQKGDVNAEVKGKDTESDFKYRAVLPPDKVRPFLRGDTSVAKGRDDGSGFLALRQATRAAPFLTTRVERQGWQASRTDDNFRVTIDSNIRAKSSVHQDDPLDLTGPWTPILPRDFHVMEVKQKRGIQMPEWLSRALFDFGLKPKGVSKYHLAVQRLAGTGLHFHAVEEPRA